MFTGRTDAEAEAPLVWPPDAKNWLIGKALDAGKDWRQEEKGTTGRDSWMASLTQWTWVWASSRSWWWTGKPGMLQSMGSQSQTRLSDWTELRVWTYLEILFHNISSQRAWYAISSRNHHLFYSLLLIFVMLILWQKTLCKHIRS